MNNLDKKTEVNGKYIISGATFSTEFMDWLNLHWEDTTLTEAEKTALQSGSQTLDSLSVTGNTTVGGTLGVTGKISGSAGIALTPNVTQFTDLVTLSATEIVGTDAGDIGHASGAILVASPGSDYILQLVSAVLIYDYLTGAYTGGGDDTVIQLGTVAQTAPIAGADLLEAAGDKIVSLSPLGAVDLPATVGTTLNLQGTALTAGTGAGVLRVYITYNVITTGL